MVKGYKRVLVVGCGGCVTVCLTGGEKEVGILSSALRMLAGKEGAGIEFTEATIERECEKEWVNKLSPEIEKSDAILSTACGAGVQLFAELFPKKAVYPAVNTKFIGVPEQQGIWTERCQSCGNCILHLTGGICPIARCSKSLLNGPCGGSHDGKCEVDLETPCAWQLIYDRLKSLNQLSLIERITPPKDWSTSRDGGWRKLVRKDLVLDECSDSGTAKVSEPAGGKKEAGAAAGENQKPAGHEPGHEKRGDSR